MNQKSPLNLRIANIYMVLVSMLLFIAALFMTAILPSLLIRYLYAGGQDLLAEPKLLEYIPVASFAIATLYFIYVVIVTTLNEMKIKRMLAGGAGQSNMEVDTELTESELAELEAIVDEAIAGKAKPRRKATTRKSSVRKTATRKGLVKKSSTRKAQPKKKATTKRKTKKA